MPYHPGGHKPQAPIPKTSGFPLKNRLRAIGCGGLLVFGGLFRMSHGVFFTWTWYRQPFSSLLLAVGGGIVILVALLPSRWIDRVTGRITPTHSSRK